MSDNMSEHMQRIAQLRTNLAIANAKARADPIPYLNAAHHMLGEAREAINEARRALLGVDMMMTNPRDCKWVGDFNETGHKRCLKALAVLDNFMDNERE